MQRHLKYVNILRRFIMVTLLILMIGNNVFLGLKPVYSGQQSDFNVKLLLTGKQWKHILHTKANAKIFFS